MIYLIFRENNRFVSHDDLIYVSEDRDEAHGMYLEMCIRECIDKFSTTCDYVIIPFFLVETVSGTFDMDLSERSQLETMHIKLKDQFSMDDFKMDNFRMEDSLSEYIDLLNESIAKIRVTNRDNGDEARDAESAELYRRFVADQSAYLLMRKDGLAPPHPVFRKWSSEQLRDMTFEEYNPSNTT